MNFFISHKAVRDNISEIKNVKSEKQQLKAEIKNVKSEKQQLKAEIKNVIQGYKEFVSNGNQEKTLKRKLTGKI